MTGQAWEPGTVAMVTAYNRPTPYRAAFTGETWRECASPAFCVDEPTSIHPLAVIDPEDRQQVERLIDLFRLASGQGPATLTERWEWALREFAQPTPPKPEEPTGLGAVVAAIHDNHFVHMGDGQWHRVGSGVSCDWDDIAVVRVLSEGVQA